VNYNDFKVIGEWHEDKFHGIAMEEWDKDTQILSAWGQIKHGIVEGYSTVKYIDGRVNYFQNKNDEHNGYGIETNKGSYC
jgi:hypothetical protein